MKSVKLALILIAIAAGALLVVQKMTLAQTATPGTDTIRLLSPQNGQKLAQNFVAVRYEITNPAAAASPTPTFQLQLDDHDPVHTASTEHTFTGLAPGEHTLMLELVDANNTPIAGSRRIVHFIVAPAPQPTSRVEPSGSAAEARLQPASYSQEKLPASGSTLPLLSVIGFGVLLGGIASALRTR